MNDNLEEMSAEAAAVFVRQYEIDREDAGPKLPVDSLIYRGVVLESRFSVAHEFDTMKRVVDSLQDLSRARLQSIWCDSRAQADYSVIIKPGRWVDGLDYELLRAFRTETLGFNGLQIHGSPDLLHFGPEWPENDEDWLSAGWD